MKKLLLVLIISGVASSATAQNFDEWFRQTKTQKKYLIRQIAALRIYAQFVEKGYAIAKDGIDVIGKFKQSDLNLHHEFFHSLKRVNPLIENNANETVIVDLQSKIAEVYEQVHKRINGSNVYSTQEIEYVRRVFERLADDCSSVADELLKVTSGGGLEMKDDERLQRILKLNQSMRDNYTFSKTFGNAAILLAATRVKERSQVEASRSLNAIPTTP
jgi:hypothetical protein